MINKVIQRAIASIAALMLLGSCQQEDFSGMQTEAREGYVTLRFSADIPAQEVRQVASRAVDPDGGGVQNMTLFCFDEFGFFISTASAKELTSTDSWNGTFTAEVPDNTRRVHFVANQNMTDFQEDHFRNKSESEVMALLEGSAGQMIYWARFACNDETTGDIASQLKSINENKITMLRNHALITIDNPNIGDTDNNYLAVTGMRAYNINAFGTVAPYSPTKGFAFSLDEWKDEDFVTLPQNDAKQSDVSDVTTDKSQYIFEQENRFDDPISIIIKGHANGETEANDLYYRVMLVDGNGEQIKVRRNHKYILHIAGTLSYGQATFEAATTAPATNNVWISISDDVTEVEDNNYILAVEKTFDVFDISEMATERNRTYTYTIKGKNGTTITTADKPEVTWLDNSVAQNSISNVFNVVDGEGHGIILINPISLGSNDKLEGTLLVKHGLLQRKIKVVLIKTQSFAPSWIGTAIYGVIDGDKTKRPHVSLMFTVPETCPEELFPMNVYITANELDIRANSGMQLPVVCRGDEEWYSSGDIPESARPDYKFVYKIEKPGVQRIYFENILQHSEGYEGTVYIEAKHFDLMTRTYAFSNAKYSITVGNLHSYNAGATSELAQDEAIYYCVVPQKKYAHVQFDMLLQNEEVATPTPMNAEAFDEFLFYTQNLNNYNAESSPQEITNADCYFSRYNEAADMWMRTNNSNGGRMLMFKPKNPANPSGGTGKYFLYMYTNRAKSAEVVRIASNLTTYPPVITSDAGDNGKYKGKIYRSMTFEVYNYNPFRFGARVKYAGGNWAGAAEEPDRTSTTADKPETVTDLEWTYQPGQKVDISFDVTSFRHNGTYTASVSPFADVVPGINLNKGTYFEIYIDAPMLKIDASRLTECKLNGDKLIADPKVPGRFIYRANINREQERMFGTGAALNTDGTAGVNQSGERKTLPFIVNSIVSAGDIVISSNEEQVVFYAKTFRVTNKSIAGNIKYRDAAGNLHDVPAGNFVAFERVTNSNRIGAVTITANGKYTLRLRKEYPLNWYSYPVAFHYEKDGQIYHARYNSLSDMFAAQERSETVILLPESTK